MIWLIANRAADGVLSEARVVVFVQAAIGVSSIAFGGLNWALDGSAAPVAALRRLETSLAELDQVHNDGETLPSADAPELRFRDVRFSYAHDDREVLEGVDFTIPVGSSLAIVGQNGAGKTTIAKLLSRMYAPSEGAITADGVDINAMPADQWQKLALARGFMRDEPLLVVLDEPTAALDAETEHSLFEGFTRAARGENDSGRITIPVSHQFSTVRMADLIVVMGGASVAEFGTHGELAARGGQYAELFAIQAAAYR